MDSHTARNDFSFGYAKIWYGILICTRRLSENVHLLRCTHPSSLQRTAQVRLIPQDCLQAGVGDSVRLASKHFSTASIQVVFRQAPSR